MNMKSNSYRSDKTNFTEENTMESHKVVQKPAIRVIGIDCRTSNAPEAGPQDIPKHCILAIEAVY